jgi:hypothetical protein
MSQGFEVVLFDLPLQSTVFLFWGSDNDFGMCYNRDDFSLFSIVDGLSYTNFAAQFGALTLYLSNKINFCS